MNKRHSSTWWHTSVVVPVAVLVQHFNMVNTHLFRTCGLWRGSKVSPSMDRPPGTGYCLHYEHQSCHRMPSRVHWRRTGSRLLRHCWEISTQFRCRFWITDWTIDATGLIITCETCCGEEARSVNDTSGGRFGTRSCCRWMVDQHSSWRQIQTHWLTYLQGHTDGQLMTGYTDSQLWIWNVVNKLPIWCITSTTD